jgi:hypothetical protein
MKTPPCLARIDPRPRVLYEGASSPTAMDQMQKRVAFWSKPLSIRLRRRRLSVQVHELLQLELGLRAQEA